MGVYDRYMDMYVCIIASLRSMWYNCYVAHLGQPGHINSFMALTMYLSAIALSMNQHKANEIIFLGITLFWDVTPCIGQIATFWETYFLPFEANALKVEATCFSETLIAVYQNVIYRDNALNSKLGGDES